MYKNVQLNGLHEMFLDLNSMQRIPRQEVVQIQRVPKTKPIGEIHSINTEVDHEVIGEIDDGKGIIRIVKQKSFADHPLLVGPGYTWQDVKIANANKLGLESSGVMGMQFTVSSNCV